MLSKKILHVSQPERRLGFTIIELLIAFALIALLAAMSASAFNQVALTQQKEVTNQTLRKLTSMVKDEWDAVIDQAKAEPLPSGITRAQYINNRLTQEFPMTFAEALAGGRASYKAALTGPSGPLPPSNPPTQDSSACLYLALKQNRRGMNLDLDNVLTPQSVRTRSDGLKEIVDSWGFTLSFTRVNNPPVGTDPYYIISPGRNGVFDNLDDLDSRSIR